MNFRSLSSSLFRSKYTLIRIALSDDECMRINGKLRAEGIFHKTKIKGIYGTSTRGMGWGRQQAEYEIYVRVEDEHKAHEAIERP